MTTLQEGEALAAAAQKTPHRVTLESIEARIVSAEYWNVPQAPHVTIAALELDNGWIEHGMSAPADPGNFDAELGKKFAREDAIRKLWRLEGYLLRERLWWASRGAALGEGFRG